MRFLCLRYNDLRKKTDRINMGIKDYVSMSLAVLKDIRVIATVIVMLLVIEFAHFITSYRKRAKKPKVKKVAAAKAPKATPEKSEEKSEEAASE